MSFHARKSDLRPENFKFSVLSLADLKSDISTGVGGEGVRDGRSTEETRGVGAVRGGRGLLEVSGETGVLALEGALVGTGGCG